MAWWTRGKPTVTCTECIPAAGELPSAAASPFGAVPEVSTPHAPADRYPTAIDPDPEPGVEINLGVAGRSAMGEFERRHAGREARIRERWGRLAGLVLALSDDPQSTRAWQRGSTGETKLAKALGRVDREDIVVLNDRKVPGTKGNIDHLVLCPAGVFVVDSKHYEGQVHTKNVGGLITGSDLRLIVGRRDCTRLATAIAWQVAAVKTALDGNATPVHPVLCFIDAEWPLFGGPREFQGVLIESDRSLRHRITQPGELDVEAVRQLAMVLAHRLPAST